MVSLQQKISELMILDGGLATELTKDGFNIDGDPLWSARLLSTNPDAIKNVHRRFLDSGSDIIITSSYQASIPLLMQHCHCSEEKAKQYIESTVTLAKEARTEFWNKKSETSQCEEFVESDADVRTYPLIAGSVGPYGACQHDGSEYSGTYVDSMSMEELMEWHRPRLRVLVESGVDLIAVETIPALKEALAITKVLSEFSTAKAWITFSCKDAVSLCHGESFAEAIFAVSKFDQIFGIGVNCTNPKFVEGLLLSINGANISGNKMKVVYPNSGEMWKSGKWIENSNTKRLAEYVPSWLVAGASWIVYFTVHSTLMMPITEANLVTIVNNGHTSFKAIIPREQNKTLNWKIKTNNVAEEMFSFSS